MEETFPKPSDKEIDFIINHSDKTIKILFIKVTDVFKIIETRQNDDLMLFSDQMKNMLSQEGMVSIFDTFTYHMTSSCDSFLKDMYHSFEITMEDFNISDEVVEMKWQIDKTFDSTLAELIAECENTKEKYEENILQKAIAIQQRTTQTVSILYQKITENNFDLSLLSSTDVDFSEPETYNRAVTAYQMNYLLWSIIKLQQEFQYYFRAYIPERYKWNVRTIWLRSVKRNPPQIYLKPIENIHTRNQKNKGPIYSFNLVDDITEALLRLFYDALADAGFVPSNCFSQFRLLFKKSMNFTPLKWLVGKETLYYLIYLLKKNNLFSGTSNIWQTCCACFLDENGEEFSPEAMKKLHKPSSTSELVEKIVRLLLPSGRKLKL